MMVGLIAAKHVPFQLDPVPLETLLWRVMTLDKLRTILEQGGLWFARLDQFGDPLEGQAPARNLGLLNKYPAEAATWAEIEYGYTVLRSYASCWHMSDLIPVNDMWETFGGAGEDALAIQSSGGQIASAIDQFTTAEGPIYFHPVQYIDHLNDTVKEGNFIFPAYAVQTAYSYEREARILIHTAGTIAYKVLYGRKGPLGSLISYVLPDQSYSGKIEYVGGTSNGTAIVLPVDPRRLITRIVRGPNTSDKVWGRIHNMAEAAGISDRAE